MKGVKPSPMPAERDNFVRLLYVTLLVQFFIIAILFGALSNEYISNAYMQAWIGRNAPLLGIILSGEVDSAFVGVAVVFTIFLARHGAGASETELTTQPNTQSPAPVRPSATPSPQNEPVADSSTPSRKRRSTKKKSDDVQSDLEKTDS